MANVFIELTCLADGRPVFVRTETISRIYDMGEEYDEGALRPSHTLVVTNDGAEIRCTDDYRDVVERVSLYEM